MNSIGLACEEAVAFGAVYHYRAHPSPLVTALECVERRLQLIGYNLRKRLTPGGPPQNEREIRPASIILRSTAPVPPGASARYIRLMSWV